jgi:AraC family transcriptional regulator
MVEDLMDAQLGGSLTIADMAAACGLSAGFFLRAFKAATGETPHRALMSRRIAAARQMLAEDRHSLAEIAQRTGFSSQAHMTMVFGKAIGMTPSAYRAVERTGELT